MPKVLVTGGAGFIGSHVADRFADAGYAVEVLDNLSTGRRTNLRPGATLHEFPVQSPEAAGLVRTGNFDVIAHLAAQTDVRKSVADPLADMAANTAGTVNLLEAVRVRPAGRPPRFVFTSTGGALYGAAAAFPTAENAPANPDSPYGIAKLSSELYAAYYARIWGLETVTLRFANVYGPRQDPFGEAGVVAIFSKLLTEGRPLTVYGTGRQTRDYVYVADVADAVFAAATANLPDAGSLDARAFNIGTGVETSVIELAETLAAVAGVKANLQFAPARKGEADRSALDVSRAARQLQWTPRHTLREGLARTYEFIAEEESGRPR